MLFDPISDYANLDLSENENLIRYNFKELIIVLIILSSPAKRQREIIGYGRITDEMALDFDYYYSTPEIYIENALLNAEQKELLDDLNQFFDERSGEGNPEFWNDDNLETHPEWELARNKAKTILAKLGMNNLDIEIERIEKYNKTIFGRKKLLTQTTKIKLVK